MKKNITAFADKKLAVFAVGASPYDEKAIMQIREMHFKGPLNNIPLFYCRGAWDEDIMTVGDRTLCRMLQKAVAKQDHTTLTQILKRLGLVPVQHKTVDRSSIVILPLTVKL